MTGSNRQSVWDLLAQQPVLGLGSDGQLVIESDGRELPVPRPATDDVAFLLLDSSASMRGDKISQARAGARRFAHDALAKNYAVGLIAFASNAELVCAPCREMGPLAAGLGGVDAGGSTDLAAALKLALAQVSGRGRQILVVATDGQPDSREEALAAAREARAAGLRIIAIGTDDADEDFLRLLAGNGDLAVKVEPARLGQQIASAALLLPEPRHRV